MRSMIVRHLQFATCNIRAAVFAKRLLDTYMHLLRYLSRCFPYLEVLVAMPTLELRYTTVAIP